MRIWIVLFALCCAHVTWAQESSFTVDTSKDTLLMGNSFTVSFTIKNMNGDFDAPALDDFDIMAGPNVSSSFSFMNGQSSQEMSYSYILKPKVEGAVIIPPAYLVTDSETVETQEKLIFILPNPDGIIEQDGGIQQSISPFQTQPQVPIQPTPPTKPKRKVRKI